MKINLFIFIAIISAINLHSQIKEHVVVILPTNNPIIVDSFTNKANELEENDREELSKIYRSFTDAGHGSGFIITHNNNNYILTNKHVIDFSSKLEAYYTDINGNKIILQNIKIAYIDRELDIALLSFDNNEVLKGLVLSEENIYDGQDVWSAGYPGLLGEPGWQFAKGNITNINAKISKLLTEDLSYLIQHSAPIDPGNSGGPLMIETTKNNFSVVGINTWSITNRNNTFFAIPNETIKKFLSNSNKDIPLKESFDISINLFLEELNKDDKNQRIITSFISNNLVGEIGLESYYHILETSSLSLRNKWKDSFFYNSALRTSRGAIYERLTSLTESGHKLSLEKINYENNSVTFKVNNKKLITEWNNNNGIWQIERINLNKFTLKSNYMKNDKKDEHESDISPAAYNFLLPGLTQLQRKDINGIYYTLSAFYGLFLIADSAFNLTGMYGGSGMEGYITFAGLAIYTGAGTLSFMIEIFKD